MIQCDNQQRDITSEYWREYFEWRSMYGLSDECMYELIAAIRAEADHFIEEPAQQLRLLSLANLIEQELNSKEQAA